MKQIRSVCLLALLLSGINSFALPGQVDSTFTNLTLGFLPNTVLALPDGRVVVGFNNSSPVFNGTNVGAVLQLNANGTFDSSFAASDTNKYIIYTITRLASSNLLVAGNFTNWAGTARKTLVELDATGAVQTGFFSGVSATAKIYTAEQPDGKIIIASSGTSLTATNGAVLPPVARLLADGTRDTNFLATNIIFTANALDMVPDGSGRYFLSFLNLSTIKYQLSRFNSDGTIDSSFIPASFDSSATMIRALPSGGAVVCGGFTTFTNSLGTNTVPHLVRFNSDGTRDTSFNFTDTRTPQTFALQSDGKIIVPGNSFVGQDRFNDDGSLDASWNRSTNTMSNTTLTIDSSDRALCSGLSVTTVFRMQNDASFGSIPPFFNTAPANANVYPGDSTNFNLNAGGPGVITYQWQFNSNNIAGATNTTLNLFNCQLTNAGFYRLVASNSFGSTPSLNAQLAIRLEPRITQNPAPLNADASDTVNFSVAYSSLSAVSFQWFFNSAPIVGATNNPLVIPTVSSNNAGNYSVVITNSNGSATSTSALLSVNSTLRFKTQPITNLFTTAGIVTNISAVAAGEPALSYQWFMNGTPLAGATTSIIPFNPIDRTNSGAYYLVVSNNSGSITSVVARVTAFGAPLNSWVNTNPLPSGTVIADLKSDGPLGVVLIGNNGVSRIDDDGGIRWTVPFTPSTNIVTGGFGRLACAVDGLGNTFVTCPFTGTVTCGGLSATNPGNLTVSNPNARGAFLAKIDITGQPLWMRYIDGGLDFTKLAIDGGGGVIISGAHNSVVNFGNGGTQATPNSNGGALARYNPDGTLTWVRNYASTTGGTVEIDAVAAQGTNIWVGGIFNFNVKFGAFTVTDNSSGHAANSWFGCLSTNGTELWLQSVVVGSQFMQLGVGPDNLLWAANGFTSDFLLRFSTNGSFAGGGTPFNPAAPSVGCINIDSNNVAVLSGGFSSTVTIGTNTFNRPNTFTNFAYTGRFDTNGAGQGAIADGFSTANSFQLFAGDRRGDSYLAGNAPARIGTNNITGTNFYLVKVNAPGLAPTITSQPFATYNSLSLSNFQISVIAQGQLPISYQWRNNGVPIASQTNATLSLISPLPPDGGNIDCVVSNAYGTATTSPALVTFIPPFNVIEQPASSEIIFGTNDISGTNILDAYLQPGAMVGHQFNFFITNGSGMWPMTANFTLSLPSTTVFSIPTGTLGTHAGNWVNPVTYANGIGFSLLYWSTSPSNVMTSINMFTDGRFDIHHDITDPAGCCATGYYTIAADGNSNVTFRASISGSVVPTIQWFHDGVALAGQTNSTLNFTPAGYPQVGTYIATLTYGTYVTNTTPATFNVYPPALGYSFVPANSAMNFAIPPGYALQSTSTLSPPAWTTVSISATYNVPLDQPGAYFRIVPQ